MTIRTADQVQETLEYFRASADSEDTPPHPHDIIRNVEFVNACQQWLDTPPDQRAEWLARRASHAEAYRAYGDDSEDVEMSAYHDITQWLNGEWDWPETADHGKPTP